MLHNLTSAPVLFFLAGGLAVALRSDLSVPRPISKALSLYLLFAIGLKGGGELAHSSFQGEIALTLGLALASAALVPLAVFAALRKRLDIPNAGAIASTYGSVSAVTFVTAVAYLDQIEVVYGGHMVAALALMESPAIVVGVVLVRWLDSTQEDASLAGTVWEALTNGSVYLILASLLIGFCLSDDHRAPLEPFTGHLFQGMLTLFLLDMGILAAKRIGVLKDKGLFLVAFAIVAPLIQGAAMIAVCVLLGVELGNALLLTVLSASASYIAVPAAMRTAVPRANPGIYVPLSIGITFPFNVIFGIPMYHAVLEAFA